MPREAANRNKKSYKKHLLRCMNLVKGTNHSVEYNFSAEELFELTPDEIVRYFCVLAYGTETPDLNTDHPTSARSNTLEYAKKAISSFMPNKNMVWNSRSKEGNPTRSSDVTDLIKVVKKAEVRKLGVPSQARRALTTEEFRQIIRRIRQPGEDRLANKYSLAAYFIFQCHMIARVDDVMHFKHVDLTPHLEFDFALKSKMCWSKNLLDERSTTDQIILGAADTDFCTLLALAIHLETNIENGLIGEESTLFGIKKQFASNSFKSIVEEEEFRKSSEGELGSHSIRKYSATLARRNGCSKDDVNMRGRWKGQKRIVDTYIDMSLPYPDAKVAASLCIGGAIKYELRSNSRISNDWLVEHVSKNIASLFPRQMAIVLGKALLWAICDDEASQFIDSAMVQRVRTDVRSLNGCYTAGLTSMNPVRKVPLIVNGEEGVLIINELEDDVDDVNLGHGVQAGGIGRSDSNQIRMLVSAVKSLSRQNEEMKNELHIFKTTCNTLLSQLNTSVKRISIIPGIRSRGRSQVGHVGNGSNPSSPSSAAGGTEINTNNAIPYESTLCKCPKSLHVLWQEYEFGVGGRKPAKLFSARERGRVKFNYSLRNHFWLLMNRMILRGYTHAAAIDKIYSVYGTNLSATKILRMIRSDSKTGGHAQLR